MEESLSMFYELNNSVKEQYEAENVLANGTKIFSDGVTILRFKDGFLDGDIFDEKGKLVTVKPAVEGNGHIEYWRKGKLHRDDGLPAVSTKGFSVKEYWIKGIRQE